MAQVKFNGTVYKVSQGQTVLDTLLENQQDIANSCRAGACQSCLMQVTKGVVPEASQNGLKDSYKAKGYFLACSCKPEEDIDVCLPDTEQLRVEASVSQLNMLADDVVELKLKTSRPFEYFSGQYVTLWRDKRLGRSYSLASLPGVDEDLIFHIKLIPGGAFSSWVHNELNIGDTVFIQGPAGDCFYTQGNIDKNILLIGTGTGLAPLYGIVRDAIQSNHQGEIHLFHGGLNPSGLYLHEQLESLSREHANFYYHPCVLKADSLTSKNIIEGDIANVALQSIPDMKDWKAYLCGDPELVNKLRKQIFLAGCNMNDIYADPFLHA